MRSESIGDYEIEYAGQRLPESEHWGAFAAVYGPSHNPMHRNCVFHGQRVNIEVAYDSEAEAEAQARKVALDFVEGRLKA